ncbi:MAG TPA: IS4 family transposase, partial [Flavisolibacter sp.]|nr:IS4 family transposase [Flavisolibacter sp.]
MVAGQELSGSKRLTSSIFGDKRLDKQYEQITQAIASKQHACIYRLSSSHSQRTGFYRFLDNEAVSLERLQLESRRRCALAAEKEDTLLVLHDTTDFDYSFFAGQPGLGPIGNHQGEGYFAHVSMAVSTTGFTPLGIASTRIWHRKTESKKLKPYHIAFEQKESCRWIQACQAAATALAGANLIHIQDREGDMYDTFAIAEGKHHLLIRSRADRIIETQQGKRLKLSSHLQQVPVSGHYRFPVNGECGKKQKREALMQLKYTRVALQRPNKFVYQKHYARQVLVWVIEATEVGAPQGESPVYWRLLTTLPVCDLEQALEKVYYYTRRW